MSFLDKFIDTEKTAKLTVVNPQKVFQDVLKKTSGTGQTRELKYNIYYQIVAFYGVVDGVGTSTLVANTAIALAETGLTVCVIDTSILSPVQDVLLNTSVATIDEDDGNEHLDWFDMPFTKSSVLHVSKIKNNISVLSFKGKRHTVVDFLSTNDSESLVEIALGVLHNKFDILLIDCCHEMSAINTACLQQSQQVIQVWNDSPSVVANLEGFITNAITLSCPLDKMRYVVCNKMSKDAMGDLTDLIKQYRCRLLTTNYLSEELYLSTVIGKQLFRRESTDPLVIKYTESIIEIACHLLNIDLSGKQATGTVTSQDILDGKVDGTYHKELKDFNDNLAKEHPDVVIDSNPMGYSFDNGVDVEGLYSNVPDDVKVTQEEQDAINYGSVMSEDDIKEEELEDSNNVGVADILQDPKKAEKRRSFFGKKKKKK